MSTVVRLSSFNTLEDGTLKTDFKPFPEDAFNRVETSAPVSQFEYANQYNKGPLVWNEKTSGTSAGTHEPSSGTVILTTGTASGDSIIRQTKKYFRYQPMKSLNITLTFAFLKEQANIRKRAGYFDADNGVFIEQLGSTYNLVLRSKSSGIVTENRVPKSKWSDCPEDFQFDFTKAVIFGAKIQWLGVGTVTCGIEIDGQFHVLHRFHHAGYVDTTYMTSANLPLRYEIENISGTGETGQFRQICSSVVVMQGAEDDKSYYSFSVNNGITPISVSTRRAVLSIRPKATFNSLVNRGQILPEDIDLTVASQNILWEVIVNGALGGTPSWTSAGDDSIVEFDVAGTTVTGGQRLASGYLNSGTGTARQILSRVLNDVIPLALDIDGANPNNYSIVCTAFTSTATVTAVINGKELY